MEKNLISPFQLDLLSGCSYDLRVGGKLTSRNRLSSFDLSKASYVFESGECITVDTMEAINLREVAAFGIIANKHSLAATGIFHPITTIDPGFSGPLALTFFNLGNVRRTIRTGDPIAKVFFIPLIKMPKRIYGVTQRPSYREGETAVALIVDQPQHRDDDDELEKMYGAPVRKLYQYLREFKANAELVDHRRRQGRRDRQAQWLFTAGIAVFSALLTVLLRENWSTVIDIYHRTVN